MEFSALNYGQSVQITDDGHDYYECMGKVCAKYAMSGTCQIILYNKIPPVSLEVRPEQLAHIAN